MLNLFLDSRAAVTCFDSHSVANSSAGVGIMFNISRWMSNNCDSNSSNTSRG